MSLIVCLLMCLSGGVANAAFANLESNDLAIQNRKSFIQARAGGSSCGGTYEGIAGVINYKTYEPIASDEMCVWTIRVPSKNTIQVRLIEHGFNSPNAALDLVVYNFTDCVLGKAVYMRGVGDKNVHTITGNSMILVSFQTYGFVNATGFSLFFEGVGPDPVITNDSYAPLSYKIFEQQASAGRYNYPVTTYPNREFVTFTVHPTPGKRIALTLEKFYRSGTQTIGCGKINTVFAVTQFSWSSETLRFTECQTNQNRTTIYSRFPMNVAFYTFIGPTASFEFSWEMV